MTDYLVKGTVQKGNQRYLLGLMMPVLAKNIKSAYDKAYMQWKEIYAAEKIEILSIIKEIKSEQ